MKLNLYLKEFVLKKKISERQFALAIEMSPSQFNKYIKGQNVPGGIILQRIKEKFPDFDPPKEISESSSEQLGNIVNESGVNYTQNYGNLTIVPLKAYGGFLRGYQNRVFMDSLEYASFPFIKGKCFAFEVENFSMSPEINPGDYVVCTEIPDPNWLTKNKVYVFQTIDGLIIKSFVKIEGDLCFLQSINSEYNPVDPIPVKSIKKIYYKEYVIKK